MKKAVLLLAAMLLISSVLPCAAWAEVTDGPHYTVIFDKNTTPDDLTDDETFSFYTVGWGSVKKSSVVTYPMTDDAVISPDDVPTPTRKGWYFAGWHTVPVVTESDMVNGVAKTQVFFGHKVSELGANESAMAGVALTDEAMYIKDFETLEPDGTLRLYARWVEAKEISDEEGLRSMAEDLYGAYILTDDITLNGNWTPIGAYFSNYTYYETSWWTYAFRGTLLGDGHTIRGLTVSSAEFPIPVDPSTAIWHDDGDNRNGTAGLFAAICGATIKNLTLEDAELTVYYSGDYCYVAPLACFDMASTLVNVQAVNPRISVIYTDESIHRNAALYMAVGGLEAGGWSSNLTKCGVQNAQIDVSVTSLREHGGNVFVGGLVGECFVNAKNGAVEADIRVQVADQSDNETDRDLVVSVGGLGGSNTSSIGNAVKTSLDVTVDKPQGQSKVSLGGFAGVQLYQSADNNTVEGTIITHLNLDAEQGEAFVGSVLGRIDAYYVTLILKYASEVKCGIQGNEAAVTLNGETLSEQLPENGLLHVDGQAVDYVAVREYTGADGRVYVPNAAEVVAQYGSYVAYDEMVCDILFLVAE